MRCAGITIYNVKLVVSAALFGAVSGAFSSICAVLLMLFKDARHAHLYPDYPPRILGAMLSRLPAWLVAGALAAIGVVLLLSMFHRRMFNATSPESARVTSKSYVPAGTTV